MNRIAPALALIGLVALLLASRQTADGAELLVNAGFESGTSGWFWSDGTLTAVTTPVHGGGAAARFSADAQPSVQTVYQLRDVAPGQTYQLSGWIVVNDPGITEVGLRIHWFDSEGSLAGFVDSTSILNGGIPGFRYLSTKAVVPPQKARSAKVSVRVLTSTSTFDIYLDDFSFDGPLVTPPPSAAPSPVVTPGPTLAPTPTPAAPHPSPTPQPKASPVIEPLVFAQLTNGGFEETRDDGSPYAWHRFGGAVEVVGTHNYQGSTSVRFISGTTSTKWLHQTVAVESGEYYEASGYALKNDRHVSDVFLRVSFYSTDDGLGPAIDAADSLETLSTDDRSFRRLSTGPVQVPPTARTARFRLMLRPSSNIPAEAYFDEMSFIRVPEPMDTLAGPSSSASTTRDSARLSQNRSSLFGDADDRAGAGTSTTPAPLVALAADSTPVSLANVGPSSAPADISSADEGRKDIGWLIALALVMPAIGLATVGVWELRRTFTETK